MQNINQECNMNPELTLKKLYYEIILKHKSGNVIFLKLISELSWILNLKCYSKKLIPESSQKINPDCKLSEEWKWAGIFE